MIIEKNALSNIQSQIISLQSYKQEMESLGQIINQHTRLIEEANTRGDVASEFQAFRFTTEGALKSLNDVQANHASILNAMHTQCNTLNQAVQSMNQELESVIRELQSIKELFQLHKQEMKMQQDAFQKSFSDGFTNYRKEISAKLSEFEAKLKELPTSILDKNERLAKEHEFVLADNRSMYAKFENTELSFKAMDRKIDNVAVQVKKLLLTQPLK